MILEQQNRVAGMAVLALGGWVQTEGRDSTDPKRYCKNRLVPNEAYCWAFFFRPKGLRLATMVLGVYPKGPANKWAWLCQGRMSCLVFRAALILMAAAGLVFLKRAELEGSMSVSKAKEVKMGSCMECWQLAMAWV